MPFWIFYFLFCATVVNGSPTDNSVGRNKTSSKDLGREEAITFYRTNGSNIDMSAIPKPLFTNVTAENVVGVAPVANSSKTLPWATLKDFGSLQTQGPIQAVGTKKLFKRNTTNMAKIEKGAALFPKEAGVQSIALPPLLTLNNNMSKIPVPIPNVSVVSYAKVNTVVHKP